MERRFTDAFLETRTRRELQALCKSNGLYGKASNIALKASLKELMGPAHDDQAPKITMPSKRPSSAKTASKKAGGRRGVRAQAKVHDDAEPQDWVMEDPSPFALGVQVFSLLAAALGGQDAMDVDVPAGYATKAPQSERVVEAPVPAQAMSAHNADGDVSAKPATKASNSERVLQTSPSAQATYVPPDESDGNMLLVIARTPRLASPSSTSDIHTPSATSPTLPTTSHVAAVTGSERVAADDVSPQTEELVAGAAELQPEQQPSPSSNSIPSATSTPLPAASHVGAATGVAADDISPQAKELVAGAADIPPDDPAHAAGEDDLHLPSVASPLPSPKKPKTKTIANARERANPMSTARRPIRKPSPVNAQGALQFDAGHYDSSVHSEVASSLLGLADMRRTSTPSSTGENSPALAPAEEGQQTPDRSTPPPPTAAPEEQEQGPQAPTATRATRKSPRNHPPPTPTPTPPARKKTSEGPESPPTESQPAAALFPRKTNTAFDALLQVAIVAASSNKETSKGKTTRKGKGKKPTKAELALAKRKRVVTVVKNLRAATPAPAPRGRACTPFPGNLMDEDEDTESEDDGMEVDSRRQRPGWRGLTPQPDDRRSPTPDSESESEEEEEEEYEYHRAPTPELIPPSRTPSPPPIPSCSTRKPRVYPVTQSSCMLLTTRRRDKLYREELGDRWLYTEEDEAKYKPWAPYPPFKSKSTKGKAPMRCVRFPAKGQGLEQWAEYTKRPWEHWSKEKLRAWEAKGLVLVVESDEVRRL